MRRPLVADVMLALAFLGVVAAPLGRFWPPADILAQFHLQAMALAAVATLLALRQDRRGRIFVGLLLLGLGFLVLQPFLRPTVGSAAASSHELRVLFANVQIQTGTPPLVELEEYLAASGADVVLLAEAPGRLMRGLARPDRRFPYVAHCRRQRYCETVILSNQPLQNVVYHVEAQQGGRVLAVDLEVGGVPITLAVTHLVRPIAPGSQARSFAQAKFVADSLRSARRLVLVGDFNGVPWGRTMSQVRAALGVEGRVLLGGTWPSWLPPGLRVPIDHVLVGCGASLVRMESLPFPRSDHRAVLATVRVDPGASCGDAPNAEPAATAGFDQPSARRSRTVTSTRSIS